MVQEGRQERKEERDKLGNEERKVIMLVGR